MFYNVSLYDNIKKLKFLEVGILDLLSQDIVLDHLRKVADRVLRESVESTDFIQELHYLTLAYVDIDHLEEDHLELVHYN
jgi:hypothetical protein